MAPVSGTVDRAHREFRDRAAAPRPADSRPACRASTAAAGVRGFRAARGPVRRRLGRGTNGPRSCGSRRSSAGRTSNAAATSSRSRTSPARCTASRETSGHIARCSTQWRQGRDWSAALPHAGVVLTPAACYPVYPDLAGHCPRAAGSSTSCPTASATSRRTIVARMQMFRMHEHIRAADPDPSRLARRLGSTGREQLADGHSGSTRVWTSRRIRFSAAAANCSRSASAISA